MGYSDGVGEYTFGILTMARMGICMDSSSGSGYRDENPSKMLSDPFKQVERENSQMRKRWTNLAVMHGSSFRIQQIAPGLRGYVRPGPPRASWSPPGREPLHSEFHGRTTVVE